MISRHGGSWQESRFDEILWPELAAFVPAFDRLRLDAGAHSPAQDLDAFFEGGEEARRGMSVGRSPDPG